jgi:hypothetical protein
MGFTIVVKPKPLALIATSSECLQKFHIVYSVASINAAGANQMKCGAKYARKYWTMTLKGISDSQRRENDPNSSKSTYIEIKPVRQ